MPIQIAPRCPIRTTLELVGGKWRLALLASVATSPRRFGEIKQQITAIGDKMLHQELETLQQNHLLHKDANGYYHLTPAGRGALPLLDAMREFAQHYENHI